MDKISVNKQDILAMMQLFHETVEKGLGNVTDPDQPEISPLAFYLLDKAGYENISMPDGTPISKGAMDEITLDFTRGRTLSEEEAEQQLSFIFDKSAYLKMFNSRIVNKLVVPIEAKSITRKNLISYEQAGSTSGVNANRRIVHNFGINLYLKHVQLQKDISLQAVKDNLYNPSWEAGVINDVAVALSNDILLLVTNGLGGNYSSTKDFYDLNKGFMKILQDANGAETNTYGSVKVYGFNGTHLTPHKVDATTYAGTNTAANLLALMRSIYNAMPNRYRKDPGNAFMMSQKDVDIYVESRSDMSSPSNVTREQNLTNGITPNFMGYPVIAMPDLIPIDETHEGSSSVNGSIIFGNPRNIDVASDKTSYLKSLDFNARGESGPVFEYTYDLYLDIQVARCDSFVIAFKGAKVETPYFVSETGAKTGSMGKLNEFEANKYNMADNGGTDNTNMTAVVFCDTEGAEIYKHSASMAGMDYATAKSSATRVAQGTTLAMTADTYVRAYMPDGRAIASTEIFFDKDKP